MAWVDVAIGIRQLARPTMGKFLQRRSFANIHGMAHIHTDLQVSV